MIHLDLTIDPTRPGVKALGGATATRELLGAVLGDLLDQLLGIAEAGGADRVASFAELLDLMVDGAYADDSAAAPHVRELARILVDRAEITPLLETAIGAKGADLGRALDDIAEGRLVVARRVELLEWIASRLPEDPTIAGPIGDVVPAEPMPRWGPTIKDDEEPLET